MVFHSEPRLSIFSCRAFCGLWTNLSGISSIRLRRITYCFNDSRRPEALWLLGDADDGTSRRCRVAARPSNAQSARNRRLFTPGFAAASASNTHLAAKISHLSAHQYPLDAPSNLRNRFVRTHSQTRPSIHPHGTTTRCIASFVTVP